MDAILVHNTTAVIALKRSGSSEKSADRFRLRHPAVIARAVALSPGAKIHTCTFLITIYPRNEPMDTPFHPFYICLAT